MSGLNPGHKPMQITRRQVLGGVALLSGGIVWSMSSARPSLAQPRPAIAVIGLPATGGGTWQTVAQRSGPVGKVPLKNFGVVAPGCLYRSAQPEEKGFQWLKEQGFRGVVCLREEHDDG